MKSKSNWNEAAVQENEAPAPASLRHDLLSETTVLRAESQDTFTELFVQYVRTFDPSSPAEFDLIDDMTSAAWRIRRLWTIETSTADAQIMLQPSRDPVTALTGALTFLADTPRFHQLSRYEARLHRIYNQSLRDLLRLQRHR